MTADADGFRPSCYWFGNLFEDDGFTENSSSQNVSDLQTVIFRAHVIAMVKITVPLGLLHISLSLNSLTRTSSGVMVAHLMPTEYFLIASAESMVIWSSVYVSQILVFAEN